MANPQHVLIREIVPIVETIIYQMRGGGTISIDLREKTEAQIEFIQQLHEQLSKKNEEEVTAAEHFR